MLSWPYVICTCYSFAHGILYNSLVIMGLRSTIIILFVKLFQLLHELLPPNILENPLWASQWWPQLYYLRTCLLRLDFFKLWGSKSSICLLSILRAYDRMFNKVFNILVLFLPCWGLNLELHKQHHTKGLYHREMNVNFMKISWITSWCRKKAMAEEEGILTTVRMAFRTFMTDKILQVMWKMLRSD